MCFNFMFRLFVAKSNVFLANDGFVVFSDHLRGGGTFGGPHDLGTTLGTTFGDHTSGPHLGTTFGGPLLGNHFCGPQLGTTLGGGITFGDHA